MNIFLYLYIKLSFSRKSKLSQNDHGHLALLAVGLSHPEGPEGGVLFESPEEFLQTVLIDPVAVQVELGQVRVHQ